MQLEAAVSSDSKGSNDQKRVAGLSLALTGRDVAWADTVLGVGRSGDLATKTTVTVGGKVVIAKGNVVPGDGAGGLFYWTKGTDDGGTVIVPGGTVGSSGAGWRRILPEAATMNAAWF